MHWLARIGERLDEGWRVAYTDGCGREGHTAYAYHRTSRRETSEHTSGGYLGRGATVADSERRGVAAALTSDEDMLLVLMDSMAAKQSAINLAKGAPPRSAIERSIKSSLCRRQALGLDTGISWIRAHIGIEGNEIADRHATFESHRGQIRGEEGIVTEGGIRQASKATRAEARSKVAFGKGRLVEWRRRALSAYTWMRMGKGPQKEWLHRIHTSDDPSCPCGAPAQTGEHIVWHCHLHNEARRRNRVHLTTCWEDLDDPIWVPNDDVEGREGGDDEQVNGVERFFEYLSYHV